MSGYIPHDDDVEMAYIHGASQDYPVAGRADALRAEFDRWLAKHDRELKAEAYDEALQDAEVSPMLRNPYREETSVTHIHHFEQLGETLRSSSGFDESFYKCVFCGATMKRLNPYREETEPVGGIHSNHCDDRGCLGCECDPACDDYEETE